MKKIVSCVVIAFAFAAMLTACSKTCTCETVVTSNDPDFPGAANATFSQTIKNGKCSQLNVEVMSTIDNVTTTETTTCK